MAYKERTFRCPACDGPLYRGSYRGATAYKCTSSNQCDMSRTPIGRTKAEVRRVVAEIGSNSEATDER